VVEIGGVLWELTAGTCLPDRAEAPDYVCISYAWGTGRAPHPLTEDVLVSDRAVAAIGTAVRADAPAAVWCDAFCIPTEEPARSECLRWMGAIYGHASRAIVVLSEQCAELLSLLRSRARIGERALMAFNRDEWVTRAWTYQELVNADRVRFVASGHGSAWADGDELLSQVGDALRQYAKERGLDVFDIRSLFPRLDSLENLLLDWRMAGFAKRSAYQVIASMHGRGSLLPGDHFHAMVGALIPSPVDSSGDGREHPADYFMRLCEGVGDYSFIYTTGPRSTEPGKRWRPLASDRFHAVLPWHSFGDGQAAEVRPDHLKLRGMWPLVPAAVTPAAKEGARRWLRLGYDDHSSGELHDRLLRRLRLAGFSGSGARVELGHGFFFAQGPVPAGTELLVAVSTGVRMAQGAPGLLLRPGTGGVHETLDVGMFVGRVPERGEDLRIG